MNKSTLIILATVIVICFTASAVEASENLPTTSELLKLIDKTATTETEGSDWTTPVKMVIIFAGLAILPSLMVMMTSFTRIIIVLSFIRRALTTQTIPPNIAIIGLGLFLTLFTMAPTFEKINTEAIEPYINDQVEFDQAFKTASDHIRQFMLRQTREQDLAIFVEISQIEPPEGPEDIPLHIVVPSFVISEFRTAFEIGCLLFIPFLLLDMVIAGILLSAGMMMLPPMMISLPLKLMLFILVDGWGLLAKSLSMSFQ